jgi:hypothetical protein
MKKIVNVYNSNFFTAPAPLTKYILSKTKSDQNIEG